MSQIPYEIWTIILRDTDPYTLTSTRLTCRYFNNLINSEYFYKQYQQVDLLTKLKEVDQSGILYLIAQIGDTNLLQRAIISHRKHSRVDWQHLYLVATTYGHTNLINYFERTTTLRKGHVKNGLTGALSSGQIDLFEYFLNTKFNEMNPVEMLYIAVINNQPKMAQYILSKYPKTKWKLQSSYYYRYNKNWNIHWFKRQICEKAAEYDMTFVLKRVLKSGTNICKQVLLKAIERNNINTINWIIYSGYSTRNYCNDCLIVALGNNNYELFKHLYETLHKYRTQIDWHCVINQSIYNRCSLENIIKAIALVPDNVNIYYNSCLHAASIIKNFEMCKYFIDLGATKYISAAACSLRQNHDYDFADELVLYGVSRKRNSQ